MTKMVYQWKPDSRHSSVPAQVVGEELDKISSRDGKIEASVVVKEAKPKRSALHPLFEWDDKKAAHQHRLEQARSVVRSVVVNAPDEVHTETVRAFVSVASGKPNSSVYVPMSSAFSEPLTREQVLRNALAELQAWKDRYRTYQELAVVFAAIDDVAV